MTIRNGWKWFGKALLVAGITAIVGCGQSGPEGSLSLVPVKGRVMVGQAPLADAQVAFHIDGQAPEGYVGSGAKTDQNGYFELTVGPRKGAVPGKYKVTVSKLAQPDGSPLPAGSAGGMDVMQLRMQGKVVETIPATFSQLPYTQLTNYEVPASSGGSFEITIPQ